LVYKKDTKTSKKINLNKKIKKLIFLKYKNKQTIKDVVWRQVLEFVLIKIWLINIF
jgi:hypothetical protein